MLGTIFAVRAAAQQMDNTVCEWMADTAATPARFQVLMQLWAAKGHGVAQKDIAANMGVTRATVSGLIAAMERDGLVSSVVADNDRRSQLASLTRKGETIVEKAIETNKTMLRKVFTTLSSDDLTILTTLLTRVRQSFSTSQDGAAGRDRKP